MKRLSATAPRVRINLRAVLGMGEPDLPHWEKVRAAQRQDLRRMLPVIWAMNLLNALALTIILWRGVPHGAALVWCGSLVGIVSLAMQANLVPVANAPGHRCFLSPVDLRALVTGTIWAVPALLFGGNGAIEQQVAICLVLAGMMASGPITLTAVPTAMTLFVGPIALGLMVMMARTGSTVLTILPAIYALSLLVGGIAMGRTTLRRRWAEMALEDETSVVSLLLREYEDHGADWLWEIDIRKRLVDVTPRLAQAIAQPIASLNHRTLIGVLAEGWCDTGSTPPELRGLLDLLDGRQSFKDHVLPVMIGGERRCWRLSATPRFDDEGAFTGFRGVGSDVTEQRRNLERIDRLARSDGLTGIDNRTGFTEKLRDAIDRAVDRGRPSALIFIDLDHFKAVNDSYGHPVGDRLLRAAATRLTALAGRDDACGRLGGDEFAMLIDDGADPAAIDALCDRIQAALTRPFEIDGHMLYVGASIGSALTPYDGLTVEVLMRNADLALYRAKGDGRGRHSHFVPALLDHAERRLTIERGLRHALEQGELRLAFQPVMAVKDGALVGFEALLRWTHPDLGEIAPAEFLPIAAAARLLGAIGDWVLQHACREAVRWPAAVGLSIGLSADQALDPRLPMAIRAALAMSGLAPERLALEIAGSTLLEGGAAMIAVADRIRATGAGLVLDDFDAAFSSIRQARFDTIKIARDFLADDGSPDAGRMALARALMSTADALGLTTIVKGAETAAHHALLRHLGCARMQGDVCAPALPPHDARALAIALAGGERHRAVA